MVKLKFLFVSVLLLAGLFAASRVNAQNDTTSVITDTLSMPVADTSVTAQNTPPQITERKKLVTVIDSNDVNFFQGSVEKLKKQKFEFIDTSTLYFQQYDPLYHKNGLYSTLSNIGLAHSNQVFTPDMSVDYDIKNKSFAKYLYENEQVKYYKLLVPYTEASYYLGSKKEQNFQIVFSRELIKRLTIGLDFNLNNAPGYYENSKADDKRFFFTGQYYTKNRRYGVIANYLYNKLIVEENGGITYDSIFEQNLESDRSVIPVNLTTAQNLVKQSGFYVEQYFNLLKPRPDSIRRKIDAGSISWAFHFQRNQMVYTDNDSVGEFYKPIDSALHPAQTYDSVYQMRIRNKFQWSSIGYAENPLNQIFNIRFGVYYDYIYQAFPEYSLNNAFVYNQVENTSYGQLKPYGAIGLQIKKSFMLNGYAELVMGGYNSGDLNINASIDQYFGNINRNFGKIHAGVRFANKTPSWYFQRYQSNVYRWTNNFGKETYLEIFGEYQYRHLKGGVRFTTIGNYVYFNDSIRPAQLNNPATLLQIYIQGNRMIGKFGINTRLVYQQTSEPGAIRLPDFTGVLDLFFKSTVFKNAATLQTGFEFTYFTEYKANAYMPALRAWYIQNDYSIGNYLYADVYLTLKVKAARLFLKYAHFNGLFGNYSYYLAPKYPARDARFNFGVSWRFHN